MKKRDNSMFLDKVEAVQKIFLAESKEGVSNVSIFRRLIKPRFYISERQFYRYLNIKVKKERREREAAILQNQTSSEADNEAKTEN